LSSSSRSMSSSEVIGAGASTFSFTLHSYFIGITDRMVLKCSSLSFSAASSLIFCALIHWILLFWLEVTPGGDQ
jgi:predicted Abi (CAAX) family protease